MKFPNNLLYTVLFTVPLVILSSISARPNVVETYFYYAVDLGGGLYSDWIGEFTVPVYNEYTINHVDHGLLDVSAGSGQEIVLHDQSLDWNWVTSEADYPWISSDRTYQLYGTEDLYFHLNTSNPNRTWVDNDGVLWTENGSHIPEFDASVYNIWRTYVTVNNCYNYACNVLTPSNASPGRYGGSQFDVWNDYLPHIKAKLVSDKLIEGMYDPTTCPSNRGNIALLFRQPNTHYYLPDALYWFDNDEGCLDQYLYTGQIPPGCTPITALTIYTMLKGDYHFLRKDRNSIYWSHKPGHSSTSFPTRTDKNCEGTPQLITNPQNTEFDIQVFANYGCYKDEWPIWGNYWNVKTGPLDGYGPSEIQ